MASRQHRGSDDLEVIDEEMDKVVSYSAGDVGGDWSRSVPAGRSTKNVLHPLAVHATS